MDAPSRMTDDCGEVGWREPPFRRANPVFSEPYAVLRQALCEARRAARLSQRDLAARIGKHPSHVAMIERGQRRVDALELYRIAQAVELSPMDLLARIGARLDALEPSS